jgi:hypothetical protein
MKHYYPGFGRVPDKNIVGDGLLQAYNCIGLGDIAPEGILAHEYGHEIEFDLGILTHETHFWNEVIQFRAYIPYRYYMVWYIRVLLSLF